MAPTVSVFDEKGTPVAATVVANGGGEYSVCYTATRPDKDYVFRFAGPAGAYQLEANFRAYVGQLTTFASGSVTAAAPTAPRQLTVARGQALHLELKTATRGALGRTGVGVTIYNEAGVAVAALFARAGDTTGTTVALDPGRYTVAFNGGVRNGPAMDAATFALSGVELTDPIGAVPVTSTGPTAPTPPQQDPVWTFLSQAQLATIGNRYSWNPWN